MQEVYYLAVTGRVHTRPTLAGLFWGDQPEAAARTSLSKCLSNLRKLVGDALLVDRQTVAFNRDHSYHLDTEHFLTSVNQPITPATSHTLQATLALYQGDFLEGFYVREAPDFEQWVLVQRAHYREAVIQGLHTLANYADQQGDLSQAITHTRRLLTLEPWREEAHRQLMRLLARSGQRAAALRQYEECERLLRAELDVEPAPETAALVEWIKQTPPEASDPIEIKAAIEIKAPLEVKAAQEIVRTNLPLAVSSFVGRQHEIEAVKALLLAKERRGALKLVTLTGAGGSGKTRLALQVASALVDEYQDGVWWVDLAPLLDDQSLLPQTVAKALGVNETPNQALPDTLAHFLGAKQLLLVLDNCERLVAACTQLTNALISRCPRLQILNTSRELLGITGEQVYPVPTLTLPSANELAAPENLLRYEAIQLFVERSQALRPTFRLSEENAAAVWQICRKLDGIPLAIELAAARVRLLRVAQIATRLDARLQLLTAGNRDAPPHHQTLRATIDWSYDLLIEAERQLLHRLAVFAGSFSLDAVEQVCAPLPISILDLLAYLVDKSLVVVERDEEKAEYRLLDTIREYAVEKLIAAGEEAQLRMNHLNYFIQLAEAADAQVLGKEQKHWLAQLERTHDNMRVALNWATEQARRTEALRLAGALGQFWDMHGYWSEGRQWLGQALSLPYEVGSSLNSTDAEHSWHARALWQVGRFHWRQSDFVGARTFLQKSLTLYRKLNDQTGLFTVLSLLGHMALDQGQDEEAQSLFDECLTISLAVGVKPHMSWAFFNVGIMAVNRQDYATAQTSLEGSLKLFREVGDKIGASLPLILLGDMAYLQANYGEAQALYEESLALRRGLGDKRGIAACLASVANVRVKFEDYGMAQTHYLESLALFHELGNQRGLIRVISALANMHQTLGHRRLATTLFGAVDAQLFVMHMRLDEPEHSEQQRSTALLRTQLDEASFNAAWEKGRSLTLEQAIVLARQSVV